MTTSNKNSEMDAMNDVNKSPPPPTYAQTNNQPPPQNPQQKPPTVAEIGERYRSELYARCAQGYHDPTVKFGLCGIILAVICFPIGFICLFLDTERVCSRCGIRL